METKRQSRGMARRVAGQVVLIAVSSMLLALSGCGTDAWLGDGKKKQSDAEIQNGNGLPVDKQFGDLAQLKREPMVRNAMLTLPQDSRYNGDNPPDISGQWTTILDGGEEGMDENGDPINGTITFKVKGKGLVDIPANNDSAVRYSLKNFISGSVDPKHNVGYVTVFEQINAYSDTGDRWRGVVIHRFKVIEKEILKVKRKLLADYHMSQVTLGTNTGNTAYPDVGVIVKTKEPATFVKNEL